MKRWSRRHYSAKSQLRFRCMVRHFENIDKRYISSDAESREEQDGANHFRIEATMAKLSPNF